MFTSDDLKRIEQLDESKGAIIVYINGLHSLRINNDIEKIKEQFPDKKILFVDKNILLESVSDEEYDVIMEILSKTISDEDYDAIMEILSKNKQS